MLKDEAETAMHELVTLARFTSVCFVLFFSLHLQINSYMTHSHVESCIELSGIISRVASFG